MKLMLGSVIALSAMHPYQGGKTTKSYSSYMTRHIEKNILINWRNKEEKMKMLDIH